MQWIYLSKNGTDEYINRMAHGAGVNPTTLESWSYDQYPTSGLVIRGIMKHKLIKQCWADRRRFRFMDTGYFGNRAGAMNPGGWKVWHRVVDNDLQHSVIIDRPADRWQRLKLTLNPWKHGSKVLVVAPDEKPCIFYGTTVEAWLEQTVNEIKRYTDRPVIVRQRDKNVVKMNRSGDGSFESALVDTHAVVTFNSNAATESIMQGIPVFVTAPTNAASPVALRDLSCIERPWYPDDDLRHRWACHLSYGQFHNNELEDGTALKILKQTEELLGL